MAERFPLILRLVNSGFHLFSGHSSVVNSFDIQALASSSLSSELSAPTRSLVNSGFQNLGSSSVTSEASVAMERFSSDHSSLVNIKSKLFASIVRDLQTLHDNWTQIQATLEDAEDMEIQKKYVKDRLHKLKKLAFDVENLLDSCEYELLRIEIEEESGEEEREVCKFFTPSLLTNIVFCVEVPRMVEIMDTMISRIGDLRKALELKEKDGRRIIDDHAKDVVPSGTFQSQEEVFGREYDEKELVQRLQVDDVDRNYMLDGVHVIAIVGMGGLGKTTLAQKVYNNNTVHFDLKGWACVSENYDIVSLTKATLESFTRKASNLTQLDPLQRELHTAVEGKKFLLVLDDIWNDSVNNWETFLVPLRDGAKGSKVLVTTRNVSVTEAMKVREPYQLDCLSEEHSLMLFRKCAFNGSNAIQLEELGKSIVEKCKGLPLAVKILGRLLWHSKNNNRWNEVLEANIHNINVGEKYILGPLLFSYNHLSSNLKKCFRFCALFPKDHKINEGELVRLWMAHELIKPCEGRDLEDVGMEYIEELLSRSFFQWHTYDKFMGLIETCIIMHDLIHDLALHVSREECQTNVILDEESLKKLELPVEARHSWIAVDTQYLLATHQECSKVPLTSNYFHITNDLCTLIAPEVYMDHVEYKGLERLRALTIYDVKPNFTGNLKHLRYLSLYGRLSSIFLELMSRFYHLQTLDLTRSTVVMELPDSIGNLKKLRYLSLGSGIKKLPNSIGNLQRLRQLLLRRTDIETLPNSIGRLHDLHTLDLPCLSIKELPHGIRKLANLRRLNVFPLGMGECASIAELKDMVHLEGELSIYGCCNISSAEDAKEANLMNKRNIHSLTLARGTGNAAERPREIQAKDEEVLQNFRPPHFNLKKIFVEGYDGLVLSAWLGDPSSFKKLVVVELWSCGRCTSLSPLERLPSLMVLEVSKMASLKQVVEVESSSCESGSDSGVTSSSPISQHALFPCLRRLQIYSCQQLRSINSTCRNDFSIFSCHSLRSLPITTLPNLETLDVEHCESLTSVPLLKYPSLRTAEIKSCPKLASIEFEEESCSNADYSFASSPLETLKLFSCHSLKSLPPITTLQMLGSLEVTYCNSLTSVPLHKYPSLRTVDISVCQNLASIDFEEESYSHANYSFTSCPLETLKVASCDSLPSVPLHKYPSLRTAEIWYCPKLASIEFEEESCSNADYSFTSSRHLEKFKILHCPLAAFHPPRMQQLPSTLHTLKILDCPLLEEWCEDHGREYSEASYELEP